MAVVGRGGILFGAVCDCYRVMSRRTAEWPVLESLRSTPPHIRNSSFTGSNDVNVIVNLDLIYLWYDELPLFVQLRSSVLRFRCYVVTLTFKKDACKILSQKWLDAYKTTKRVLLWHFKIFTYVYVYLDTYYSIHICSRKLKLCHLISNSSAKAKSKYIIWIFYTM